jgi:hypothetical protein
MSATNLTEDEQKIVGACLRAAVAGPFFPEWEFSTLFGLSRSEVRDVSDRYPDVDQDDDTEMGNDDSWLAINNAFSNILSYPHGQEAVWSEWISVPASEVERVYKKWRK